MRVRGWLLLLCILLTVWNPATFAVEAAGRVGTGVPLSWTALAVLIVRLLVTGIGVAGGLALWHKRPGAVQLAKGSLALSAIEVVLRLPVRSGFSVPPGLRLPLALTLILFNAAWYLYLEKSRRVRATYSLESLPHP